MDGVKIPLTFRIYKGDQLLRTETLTQPVIKVGKLSSSHLRIDDELVSRMHAVIEVTGPGEISIIDLGSTKGTIVNGQKVNKAKLQDGDVIVLGDTRIVLGVGEAEAADEAPTKVAADPAAARAGGATGPEQVLSSSPRPPVGAAPVKAATPPTFSAPAPAPAPAPMFQAQPPPGIPAPAGIRPPMGAAATAAAAAPAAFAAAAPAFGADAAEDLGGARSIEIAAMMGDSVIHVAHLTNPKGGKVSALTYGLFASGAAALLMAVVAFQHGVHVSRVNKENLEKWVTPAPEGEGLAAVDFRPIRLSPAWDAMAFLGLAFGITGMAWGASRLLEERRSPFFRIGQARGVEFPMDYDPNQAHEAHTLVGPQGNDWAFTHGHGMKGEMNVDGKVTPLDQLAATMTIPHKARIRVEFGPNKFLISSVPAPRRQTGAFLSSMEGAVMAYFLGSAAVHLGFWLLLRAIPPEPKTIALDSLSNDSRMNKAAVKPPEEPKPEDDDTKDDKQDDSGGTGEKQALDEGKMGKKDSTRPAGQYQMKKTDDTAHLSKAEKMEAARNSGVLGVSSRIQGGLFASVTGTGDFSSGYDDRDIQGGLLGNEPGEMEGGYGFGTQGMGPGGGGTGMGTIGKGGYGTIGHGSGTGSGYGVGGGKGGMGGRRPLVPQVKIGNVSATGDLDKEIIRKYIRQKMAQFEYCYQKQLTVNPDLKGTVQTQFKIDPNGAVISASASGMGNADVEQCVSQVILSIHFPKPTGGGFVQVSYPFTFRTSG
jgi:hypothetical protein